MALCSRFVYILLVDQAGDGEADWTGDRVEARLIAAFRALPSHPVFSRRSGLSPTLGDRGDDAAALGWAARFVPDRGERLMLLTWARCRASGDSACARYKALGWSRSTAEDARRRAVALIVARLNAAKLALDSRTTLPGASSTEEVEPDLAPA